MSKTGVWTAITAVLTLSSCVGEDFNRRPFTVGERAPEYGARSFAGDSIDFADFQGQPFMVNLWATWCAPCRAEMPELQELSEHYGESLKVIGVSIDGHGSKDLIQDFLEEVGVDFQILLDPDRRFVREFTSVGVPETFLIDADGIIRAHWIGRFYPSSSANVALIEDALAL
jgi:thiol-disulfide isomerase/thioredoxin